MPWRQPGQLRERLGFYPMALLLLMGANGAFITGDLFNLYVFYEVLLMSSFVLLALGGTPSQINGAIRYVVLNLMGSMMFLLAAGITYGTLGTLNMAQISERMVRCAHAVQTLIAGLSVVAFAGKAAIFPLFFWLPSSYHTPHPAVTALFSGTLTKVGMYSLFRTFPLFFPDLLVAWQPFMLTAGGVDDADRGARRVCAAHHPPPAQLPHHQPDRLHADGAGRGADAQPYGIGLWAGVGDSLPRAQPVGQDGAADRRRPGRAGDGHRQAERTRRLVDARPVLAAVFFVAAFSLAGFPPSSGFVGKLGPMHG